MEPMNPLASAPEIALLAGALVVLVADTFISDRHRNITYALALGCLAIVTAICALLLSDDTVVYAFGGMYVADPMTHLLKMVACLLTGLMLVYAQGYARDREIWKGELFSLALFVLLGVLVMISANNLLVIYLGLELQSLSLYALIALRRDDAKATEAAMKYFVLGALASGFLLYGMSILYGATGTLDINEIARQVGNLKESDLMPARLATAMIVAGLGFKLAAVPFHMWAPDVYEGAPTPVTVLISSAPKLAAFAVTYRVLVEGLLPLAIDWQKMLMLLAIGSLIIGNVTAIAQSNLKRMLAYSTIAQMGFMLLGMLSGVTGNDVASTANAYSAALFYVLTYALTSLGTFGIIMLLARQGFEAEKISDLRGLNKRSPWFAFMMLLLMFSLAGVPPTVGFYAKLVVLQALIGNGNDMIWLAVLAVLLSLVGAFYYVRVVRIMYFDEPADTTPIVATQDMRVALTFNGLSMIVLGIAPQYLLALCATAMIKALGG